MPDWEPPLLGEVGVVWHKPRRKPGGLAEARLFAFLRGSIWYGACQYRSSHGPRDTDLLQHVAVQHRILIPPSLLIVLPIVLPVVSSAVFLSVGPSLITVGFGSSFQLLSRGFSFRHDGGRQPLEEGEGGRRSGKARVADQTAGMTERVSTPLSICLSDPQGRDKAVAQEGA